MKITLLLSLMSLSTFAQDATPSFSTVVRKNIRKYNSISNRAYENGDVDKGQYLFDTLVSNQLAGTRFDDYKLRKINGGRLTLSSIKKPLLIQTYTSWCVMNRGEIPALNKLARKHAKDLQIVVVFWDRRQQVKNLAAQFNSAIEVCYANEHSGRDEEMVATLKYAIGYLTSYYIDRDMRLVSIKKGAPQPMPRRTPIKECIKKYTEIYSEQIASLLLSSGISHSGMVKND